VVNHVSRAHDLKRALEDASMEPSWMWRDGNDLAAAACHDSAIAGNRRPPIAANPLDQADEVCLALKPNGSSGQ
jgi:hypothetical protein